jgi:hypothetical protein
MIYGIRKGQWVGQVQMKIVEQKLYRSTTRVWRLCPFFTEHRLLRQ